MSFDAVLALTPRRFWFLLNQIQRLRAEESLALFEVQIGSQADGEGRGLMVKGLQERMGQVYVWSPIVPSLIDMDENEFDPEFDRQGLQALRDKFF